MSTAIEYMNNFSLDIYRNLSAEQNHLLYKSVEKEFNFLIAL